MDHRKGTLSADEAEIRTGQIEWIPLPGRPGPKSGARLHLDQPLTDDEAAQINDGALQLAFGKQHVVMFPSDFVSLSHDVSAGESIVEVKFSESYDPDQ